MFGNKMLEKIFADQFEPEDDHFLFRRNMKEAPVPVSAAERERYIDIYNRHLKRSRWVIVVGIILLSVPFVVYETLTGKDFPAVPFYAALTAIVIVFVVWNSRVRGLPTRELKNRANVGEVRSRAEWRRVYLRRMSYWQLIIPAMFAAIMLISAINGPRSGWDIFWLIISPFLLAVTAIQLIMKWRLGVKTPPGN